MNACMNVLSLAVGRDLGLRPTWNAIFMTSTSFNVGTTAQSRDADTHDKAAKVFHGEITSNGIC